MKEPVLAIRILQDDNAYHIGIIPLFEQDYLSVETVEHGVRISGSVDDRPYNAFIPTDLIDADRAEIEDLGRAIRMRLPREVVV